MIISYCLITYSFSPVTDLHARPSWVVVVVVVAVDTAVVDNCTVAVDIVVIAEEGTVVVDIVVIGTVVVDIEVIVEVDIVVVNK